MPVACGPACTICLHLLEKLTDNGHGALVHVMQAEMDGSNFVGAAWRDVIPPPATSDVEAQVRRSCLPVCENYTCLRLSQACMVPRIEEYLHGCVMCGL